jgi:hypothetical protein
LAPALLRPGSQTPTLSELAGSELFVFERLDPAERDKVVITLAGSLKKISVLPTDPINFISELHAAGARSTPRQWVTRIL